MANILGSILSSFRKKDDEDELKVQQPKPKAPMSLASGGGGIGNAIRNTQSKVSNFFQSVPQKIEPIKSNLTSNISHAHKNFGDMYFNAAEPVENQPVRNFAKGMFMQTRPQSQESVRLMTTPLNELSKEDQTTKFNQAADLSVLGLADGGMRKVAKPVVEQVSKKVVAPVAEKVSKQVVKTADELAPMLKGILPQVKGNFDNAIKQIQDAGVEVSDKLMKQLKSGKVVEGEGYVLQLQEKTGKFIANFDNKIKSVIPERKATETVEEIGKEASDAIKQTTKGAKQVDEALEEGASVTGDTAARSVDDTAEAVTKDQEFGAEVAGRKGLANLDDEARAKIEEIASDPKFVERMERLKGGTLTEDEVRQAAVEVQDLAEGVFSKKQTQEQIAKELNVVNKINELMEDGSDEALAEAAPLLERWLSQGTDLARRLQARKYAGDPSSPTGDEFLKTVFQNADGNKAQILKEYKAVDRSDPQQFREFFFRHVKPTMGEIIDEYRYINILSSPKSQIRNVNANLIDSVFTEPGTKIMRGFVDGAQSAYAKLTGVDRPRENFSREAVAYYQGYYNSLGDAVKSATEVLQGKRFVGNPDLQSFQVGKYSKDTIQENLEGIRLPTRIAEPVARGTANFLEKGGVVNKALEAGDIFFSTLVKNGEQAAQAYRQSRGVNLTQQAIDTEAARVAEDLVLRTPIGQGGHGLVNDQIIDGIASTIGQLRNSTSPVVNVTANALFPFVRTTANYVKRFIDYTPGAGLANLPGRADKAELVARQLWSSTLMMGALWYAFRAGAGDNMTWEAPTGEKERELFYASGRKPYSVKIAGQWVNFQQLGMIGAPFALTAALKHEIEQDKDVSESMLESVSRAYGELLPFFGDMSFARSFGNLSDAMSGDGAALQNLLNEPFRQAVPLAGFTGWARSIIDPVFRKSESKSENVVLDAFAPTLKNIPGFSQQYEAYTDPLGQESRIDKPILNSLSAVGITSDNPLWSFVYENDRLEKQASKLERDFGEGKIDALGVETGVNRILQNAINFAGGDSSQAPRVRLPDGVDPSFKVEEEVEKFELTPEQEQEMINAIPQLKEQMLSSILGGGMNIGGMDTTTTSGRVASRGGFKVGNPPSQRLASSTGINISSILNTPRSEPESVAGISLPSTTTLANTLPQQNITADELLRRANRRAA